jgi:hypothetical protein
MFLVHFEPFLDNSTQLWLFGGAEKAGRQLKRVNTYGLEVSEGQVCTRFFLVTPRYFRVTRARNTKKE